MFMLNSTLSYVYKCRYLYEIFFSWLYIYTCKDVHDEKKSANSYSLFLPFRIPLVKWRPKLMTWAVRVSLTISEKGEKLCSCKQDLYSCTHPLCCVAQLAYNLEKSALCGSRTIFLEGAHLQSATTCHTHNCNCTFFSNSRALCVGGENCKLIIICKVANSMCVRVIQFIRFRKQKGRFAVKNRYIYIPSGTFQNTVYYFAPAGSNFEPIYIFEVIYGPKETVYYFQK